MASTPIRPQRHARRRARIQKDSRVQQGTHVLSRSVIQSEISIHMYKLYEWGCRGMQMMGEEKDTERKEKGEVFGRLNKSDDEC